MDDKLRSQALKALGKANIAAEAAVLELEDVLANGCGVPKVVEGTIQAALQAKSLLAGAHAAIRTAHVAERNAAEGSPLPFPEGEESTPVPRKRSHKKKAEEAGEEPAAA